MVAALRELLSRAERGALRGFAYVAKTGPKRHRVGFTGDYWDEPGEAILAGGRMQYKANQLMSALHDEPDTETMSL
jgi:hypothetical protein